MRFSILLTLIVMSTCNAHINDYLSKITNYFGYTNENNDDTTLEGFQQKIPYEVSTVDEKFIEEAAKLTGVSLSELDKCQQRIVLKLKKGCQEMNDEDVSKMAVMLLNCQSAIEERRLYPCNEHMSIKDCTTNMDADTWNAYHLMANRVRAVCYTARQSQFIGITEHTINRLLDTTRNQIHTLDKLVSTQENLSNIAQNTLKNVVDGNKELKQQQVDIAKSQFQGQLVIEDNIRRLIQEKQLISESHGKLAEMSKNVQDKLELAMKQLEDQNQITHINHKELLEDLIEIQKRTQEIFERIDESSHLLFEQNQQAQKQYAMTLKQLYAVNSTVHSLVSTVYSVREMLDEKLTWISTALGGTDIAIDRLYLLLWHTSFIVVGMIICAFLNCNLFSRIAIIITPIANLICALYQIDGFLSPVNLLFSIVALLLTSNLIYIGCKYTNRPKSILKNNQNSNLNLQHSPSNSDYQKTVYSPHIEHEDVLSKQYILQEDIPHFYSSPTPPLSRSGYYSSRSRSQTPLNINTSGRSYCKAFTKTGASCKISSMPGREYCFKHQNGSSVIM